MNTPAPSTPTIARSGRSDLSGMRLYGRWLVIARVTWFVVVGLVGALFIASMPPYVAYLHTLTTGVVVDLNAGQLTPAGVRALQALDLSIDFYAIYHLVLNAVFLCGFLGVGSVLFWRKADDRMALFTSFTLVTFPISFLFQTTTLPLAWVFWVHITSFLSSMGFCLFFYLFPNGRFVPRWTSWLLIGWVVEEGIDSSLPLPAFYYFKNVLLFALLVSLVAAQMYRYRRVSTPLERHQTQWVVLGFLLAIAGFLGVIILGTFFPALVQPGTLAYFVGDTSISLFLLLIPLSIGIAIMRYRLWDIDSLINLALVYGLLTGVLAALYAGLIIGLESLAGLMLGQGSQQPVVLVISTLAVAALFLPVRRRIQYLIDRRFYRHKYDAEKTLATFSATLRNQMDLDHVRQQLLAVVNEAMQPAHVSLWLHTPEQGKENTHD